ncbi:MAG: choice-of-anchor J domain-containing protein, partial [Bacteroidota bacterium]|nr:choice-of-anchor J domain-containing protein [Bacteroidota bacterium]
MRIFSLFLLAGMLLSFNTISQTTLPYVEDFEGIPTDSGWTVTAASGSDGWIFGGNPFPSIMNSSGFGAFGVSSDENCGGCDKSVDLMISPALDLSGHTFVSLEFRGYFFGFQGAKGYVLVSFDNGVSWADTAYTMLSTGSWEDISVDLSAYVDSVISLGFHYSDPNTNADGWGFGVDEVNVYEPLSYDIGITGWTIPQSGCGLSNNESIGIDIVNLGQLDASNITISYSIDGGSTFVDEIIPGPIPYLGEVNYTFSQKADLSNPAIYNIELAVTFALDEDLLNNSEDGFVVKSMAVIDQFPFSENFDSGNSIYFYLETAAESNAEFVVDAGNGFVQFEGGGFPPSGWTGFGGTTTSSNAWNDNVTHHANMDACAVDATQLTDLQLQFDLDQKYILNFNYSWFRLVVNGNPVADSNGTVDFIANSNTAGFQPLTYDLTSFVGNMISISFQGSNAFNSQLFAPGNLTLVDNVSFTGTQSSENIYTLPFDENFEGQPTNTGWTTDQATGSDGWIMAAELYNGFWYPQSNINSSISATSNDAICNCDMSVDYFLSPKLNLAGLGGVELTFDYFFTGDYGSEGFVYVSTDGTLNNLQLLQTMPASATTSWENISINLDAYVDSVIKLVFHHNDNGSGSGFSIDNVSVTESTVLPPSVYSLPFYENFEGQPTNTGWTSDEAAGSDGWIMLADHYNSFWYPQPSSNTSIAATSNDAICNCDASVDYLISPILDLTGFTIIDLDFDFFFNGIDGSTGFVYVSTDGTLNNLQLLYAMPVSSSILTWSNVNLDLSSYAGDSIQLVFLHSDNGGSGSGFSIDEVNVTGSNPPPPVSYPLPFTENFEGQPTNPGWTTNEATGSDGWVMAAEHYNTFWNPNPNSNLSIAATSNDAICNCDASADYLISPILELTGYSSLELSFDYFFNGLDGSTGFVYVSTDGTLNNLQLIYTMLVSPTVLTWDNAIVDLSAYAGTDIQLVFMHSDNGGSGSGFSIDEVNVTGSNPPQAVYSLPFFENFESQPTNAGWTTDQAAGSDGWVMAAELYSSFWYPQANINTSIAATSNDDVCNCDMSVDYLLSPPLDLYGYTSITLNMDYFFTGDYNSDGFVYVSTDGTLNSLQLVYTMPSTSGTPSWENMSIDLSAFIGDTIQIVFHHDDNGGSGSGFSIDDIEVSGVFAPAIFITGTTSDVTCFGFNDGAIDITVTGGDGNFSYAWSNGDTTEDLVNAVAGNYSVTVTDGLGTTESESFVVNEPTSLALSEIITDVLCNGAITGAIDLTVSGGVAPYTFAWDNGELTEDISGLVAGTYTVTITDANSC